MNSIAMCTYNGEAFIKEQLESIIGQTLPPDEIIICDDCSSDKTVEIIEKTLENWNGNWHLVCNTRNLGYKKNFQKAISLCHGDIIYLSDQDDIWQLNKIELMNDVFLKNSNAVTVFHDVELVDANLRPLYPSFWKNSLNFDYQAFMNGDYRQIFKQNVMQGSACAFRREVFNKAKNFPHEAIHDEWLLLISMCMGKVIPLSCVLMKYRQDNNAIGGLPVSALQKINKWINNFKHANEENYLELKRRKSVMDALVVRVHAKRLNINSFNIASYDMFLKYRLEAIETHNWKLIFMISEYKAFYRESIKILLKDYLKMMFL